MGKLNAAALDTTVACGYNGIDQHNLGLLPPIAGIDTLLLQRWTDMCTIAPPSRGLISALAALSATALLLPPIAGIDTLCGHKYCVYSSIAPHRGGLILQKMPETVSKKIYCPLLNKEIEEGYCWEICNIATDDILLEGDTVKDWDAAREICRKCGRYEDDEEG